MDDTCSKPGCGKPVKSRGLCATHYAYAWRHREMPPKTRISPEGCSVGDCPEPHEARGLCSRHYHRYYERGTVQLTAPQRQLAPEERFWFYVGTEPCECGHGCLLWKGGVTGQGYGSFYVNGERVLAHRYAYTISIGEIPEHHQVDHVRKRGCRHRLCVNKAHLEAVSLAENVRRAQVGGRAQNGEKARAFFAAHRVARFWVKTDQSGGLDAHWPWLAFVSKDGSAKAWWDGGTRMAREIAWLLTNGEIPDGQIPQQECGRGDCMNPAHMKLVSRAADQARRAALAREGKRRRAAG
jgi:hypothetical protein